MAKQDSPAANVAEKVSKEPEAPSGKTVIYYNTRAAEQGEQSMPREQWDNMRSDGLLQNCQIIRYEPAESAPKVIDGAAQ